MDFPNEKRNTVVLEGFAIFLISYALGGYYGTPIAAETFPTMPQLTIAMLSSSTMSPVIALIYVALRTKFIPKFNIKKEAFVHILPSIIMAWLVVFVSILLSGKESSFGQEILKTPPPYYYLNLFLLLLVGPVLEESLFRGYFFEILRRAWGNTKALLISSVLFVIPHGIWGAFNISLLPIFLYSVVFTLTYVQGGLSASIIIHIFVNVYLLYLNSGS